MFMLSSLHAMDGSEHDNLGSTPGLTVIKPNNSLV
jgi:hypothetical protein